MSTTGPTDWVSGERVFAPPSGTLDPDWLVPAVLEADRTATPPEARAALARAWADHRSGRGGATGTARETDAPVDVAARAVVAAAVDQFRA